MAQIRGQMLPLGIFSLAANLLLLVSSIYMLQVFDRVLSRPEPSKGYASSLTPETTWRDPAHGDNSDL